MFKQFTFIIIMWLTTINSLHAKTYIRDYTYTANELDTVETSRIIALDQIKYILLSEIGTHIRHTIKIKKDVTGSTYASENIEAITAGLTSVKIIEEKWENKRFYLKAQIDTDAQRVKNALEEFKKVNEENNHQLEELKANQLNLKTARKETEKLKVQLSQLKNQAEIDKATIKYISHVEKISSAAMYNKAFNYHVKKQYDDAFFWYRKAAEQGNVNASNNLGVLYDFGYSVKKDKKKAFHWYKKAAEQGHPVAQTNLGAMYLVGDVIKQDIDKGIHWYIKSAEQNDSEAQVSLGNFFRDGKMFQKMKVNEKQIDITKAIYWYKKSAKQNNIRALNALGNTYLKGMGVDKDTDKAIYWYKLSIAQGDLTRYFTIGNIYYEGSATKKNDKTAKYWFQKGVANGDDNSKAMLMVMEILGEG